MIYEIYPYNRIGEWKLEAERSELLRLSAESFKSNDHILPGYEIEYFDNNITVEFDNNISKSIGINPSLNPFHQQFHFKNRSFTEVVNYFLNFGSNVYIDEDTVAVSLDLGISTYFEDGLKDVGIFSVDYRESIIEDLTPFESHLGA